MVPAGRVRDIPRCRHMDFCINSDYRVGDTYEADPMEGDLERLQDSRDLPVRRISGRHHFHRPQGYPRDADRVGDTYEAYPMEGDLERLQDSRDLPVRRISGMRRFHQPQGYPRAVAPQIPYPRSQMDLDFGPEEYPKAAGGVRTAEHVEQKQGGYKSAFAVLAVLFFLMVLAALAYLAKRLLMKRQKKTMTFEAVMKNEDPAPAEKRQPVARITIEIQDVSGDSQSRRKGLVRCIFSPITALFRQSPQQSSMLDLCKQSGIAGTSKKALTSGKEEKNAS